MDIAGIYISDPMPSAWNALNVGFATFVQGSFFAFLLLSASDVATGVLLAASPPRALRSCSPSTGRVPSSAPGAASGVGRRIP
ncbi:protein of unknown function [Streptantibioticus cattleyicolor NRRL 8057 = DSM 46488]|nr:protein of unknown function [Streptantibioticus cattleyicolor NRRL 8057 = DSM 46488]